MSRTSILSDINILEIDTDINVKRFNAVGNKYFIHSVDLNDLHKQFSYKFLNKIDTIWKSKYNDYITHDKTLKKAKYISYSNFPDQITLLIGNIILSSNIELINGETNDLTNVLCDCLKDDLNYKTITISVSDELIKMGTLKQRIVYIEIYYKDKYSIYHLWKK